MPDRVRVLLDEGVRQFRSYLDAVRTHGIARPPFDLLTDPNASAEYEPAIPIERVQLNSRVEFGRHLAGLLAPAERRQVSRNAGLWNWLALYFFDDLCPPGPEGTRKLLATPHYVIDGQFVHTRYYRHLVRFAWLASVSHGENARVLLVPAGSATPGVGQWGEIAEQLGAYQGVFGSHTVIQAANSLYLDGAGNTLRGVASRDGKGSVRRLATVSNQLGITHDLRTASAGAFIDLLPHEFDRWKREFKKRTTRVPRAEVYPMSGTAEENQHISPA